MILLLLKLIGSVFTFVGANLIVSLFNAGDAASITFDLALAQNIAILIAFGLNVAIMDVKKNNLDIYTLFKINIFASIFNVAFMIAIYCLFIGYDIRVLVMAFVYSIYINISGFFNTNKKYIKASSFSTIASGLVLLSLLSLSVMNLDYTKNLFLNNLIYIGLLGGLLYIFQLLKKNNRIIWISLLKSYSAYLKRGVNILSVTFLGILLYTMDILIYAKLIDSENFKIYIVAASFGKISWLYTDAISAKIYSRVANKTAANKEILQYYTWSILFVLTCLFGWKYMGVYVVEKFYKNFDANFIHVIGLYYFLASILVVIYKIASRIAVAKGEIKVVNFSQCVGLIVGLIPLIFLSNVDVNIYLPLASIVLMFGTTGFMILFLQYKNNLII